MDALWPTRWHDWRDPGDNNQLTCCMHIIAIYNQGHNKLIMAAALQVDAW
jgi:hypothetical protein